MTLGQAIQTARRAKGLSQEQLAAQVGVSRQALGKWEKDTALPGLDNLQALAQVLEVSVDGLLGRETASAPALTLEDLRALLDARDAEQTKARRRSGWKSAMLCWNFTSTATMPRWKRCPSTAGVSRPMAGEGPIRPTCRSGTRPTPMRAAMCTCWCALPTSSAGSGRPQSSRFHRSAENGIDIPGAKKYNKSVYCMMNEGNI